MTAAALLPSGRPVTVVDGGRFEYLDEQHLPAEDRTVVSVADVLADSGPTPVQYPPAAVAPPTWPLYEYIGVASGLRRTSTSPLTRFRDMYRIARRSWRFDPGYAEGYADGLVHGFERGRSAAWKESDR